jgi:hypothetical protein
MLMFHKGEEMQKTGSRLRVVTALAATVLLGTGALTGCSSGDGKSGTTTSPAAPPGMGVPVKGDGATITVTGAYTTDHIDMYTDGSWNASEGRPATPTRARDGGRYVVVETTVRNDTSSDMDLTCHSTGDYVDAVLRTESDAIYQPIDSLYKIPGNPECNHNLGSGFDTPMTWAFLIPDGRTPESLLFKTGSSTREDKAAVISLDKFGAPAPSSKRPSPTTGRPVEGSSPADPGTGSSAGNAGGTPEPDEPSPAAPAGGGQSQSGAAYSDTCDAGSLGMPTTGPNGETLVCTGMGGNAPSRWVYGPDELQGAGTADVGGTCADGESGGQDAEGHVLLCSNGQWYPGP